MTAATAVTDAMIDAWAEDMTGPVALHLGRSSCRWKAPMG
jgi:hypothetical protein